MTYYLADHVHFCCRGDALVFLDLRRDEYTLVDGEAAEIMRGVFSEGLADASCPRDSLGDLLRAGLLTTDESTGKTIAPTRIEIALEALVDSDSAPKPRMNFGHVRRFAASCMRTLVRLRSSRIETIVARVRHRKAARAPVQRTDINDLRELTAIFNTLRPFFPRNYLCLYDSLALLEFLAYYNFFPKWVFGVTLEPWGAHCWLQEGRFVIDEGFEEAASYTAVMAV